MTHTAGGEEVFPATPVQPTSEAGLKGPYIQYRYRTDVPVQASPATHYTPNFPAAGTELDRVRWYAGIAQIHFKRYIEVVVNPDDPNVVPPQSGWYAFRFWQTDRLQFDDEPLDAYSTYMQYYIGRSDVEVGAWLDGVARGESWARTDTGPTSAPLT
ncbi:hypothetical protein ACXPWS_13590 [Mycobacterium sp. BMJ-28]